MSPRRGITEGIVYLQLGCTQQAEAKMLTFAKAQEKKPFDKFAMYRSIIWPRTTTKRSYFCAELIAATLQYGGLM